MLKAIKSTYAASTVGHILARAEQIGLIHEAKAQLKLSEVDYRAMVSAASRGASASSAELDARQRGRLLAAMRAKGYVEPQAPAQSTVDRQVRRVEDLGLIHMGQRALGMDDAAYRSMVEAASKGKSRSSSHLNAAERARVIAAMQAKSDELQAA